MFNNNLKTPPTRENQIPKDPTPELSAKAHSVFYKITIEPLGSSKTPAIRLRVDCTPNAPQESAKSAILSANWLFAPNVITENIATKEGFETNSLDQSSREVAEDLLPLSIALTQAMKDKTIPPESITIYPIYTKELFPLPSMQTSKNFNAEIRKRITSMLLRQIPTQSSSLKQQSSTATPELNS